MGTRIQEITPAFQEFIQDQKMFFVGTAAKDGRINVSPKGMDSLRVVSPNKILWLNLTGSGNETATHVQDNGRMTIMWCAFEGKPLILRVYGKAKSYHETDPEWGQLIEHFPNWSGKRQVFELEVDLVQSSCGFAVPFFDYSGERDILEKWADKQGEDRIRNYWKEKNTVSLDGKDTGMDKVLQEKGA
ncbi:pyridoxamine 5'-phosphate oxidase family protein [bacterium SCSIO 12741]|nr:pyridoxamine 5'-phosphate oxidase family protein [bacterium SCSIO 12741]